MVWYYALSHILNPSFLAGVSCGVCLSLAFLLTRGFQSNDASSSDRRKKKHTENSGVEVNDFADGDGEIKLVLVVNNDLKMGKGKVAAQCSHATVSAYKAAERRNPRVLKEWEQHGQPKVVVKGNNEEELLNLIRKAKEFNLITSLISDAGRTQIPSGSRTVLGVGPGPVHLIDEVTGHLKLL